MIAVLVVVYLFAAHVAFAQGMPGMGGFGGAGGGVIQGLIQWVVQNIIEGLIAIGIIFVGVMLIVGHHTMAGIFTMVCGAIVIANYNAILTLLPIGG